jgi:cyclase
MKTSVRIIPKLDVKGKNLIKGIHLEGLRVLGSPDLFARYYYETGADELLYMDAVASLYGRNSLNDIIRNIAKEVFIPLMVGGGIRTIEDIKTILRSGADKVAINTAAVQNPEFIKKASRMFGSSTIVISIEAIKQEDGRYLAFTNNGREYTGLEVISWAKKAEEFGAGELLLTSVDMEGTGKGFDISLTKQVSENVSIPVIAAGGAGSLEDIVEVISQSDIGGVGIASLLHYDFIKNHKEVFTPEEEGNITFLKSRVNFSRFKTVNLEEIKQYLTDLGIDCRHEI